jgi:hemerythrin
MLKNHLIWNPQRHGVGDAAIDADHRHMIALINRIDDMLGDAGQIDNAWNVMDELLLATEAHFAQEEKIMAQHGYPDMPQHIEEHRKQLEQMRNLIGEVRHAPSPAKVRLIPAFLVDWAELHILHDDLKLGAFLSDSGKNA